MLKNKKNDIITEEEPEDLPFAPPEVRYLAERYIVRVPMGDMNFDSPWKLRLFAAKAVERHLGDTVQVTSLKVRKPHLISKTKAKLSRRPACARLFVTVKF